MAFLNLHRKTDAVDYFGDVAQTFLQIRLLIVTEFFLSMSLKRILKMLQHACNVC